jgi:hypothetical protein
LHEEYNIFTEENERFWSVVGTLRLNLNLDPGRLNLDGVYEPGWRMEILHEGRM